jgi:hypothetical protein
MLTHIISLSKINNVPDSINAEENIIKLIEMALFVTVLAMSRF